MNPSDCVVCPVECAIHIGFICQKIQLILKNLLWSCAGKNVVELFFLAILKDAVNTASSRLISDTIVRNFLVNRSEIRFWLRSCIRFGIF